MKAQLQDGFANMDSGNWQFSSASPVDNWQKLFNTMFSSENMKSNQFSNLQVDFEKFSSLVGLGENKQAHEQMQEGLRLWKEYQDNYQAYRETFNNIGLKSLDKLQEKIMALAKQEKSISSLRDLYDLWVDSHEEAYSDFVLTEDYSQLYGRLINSMLAFRSHSQQFTSESLKSLNLSTVDKQDTLQQELLDVKQQQRQDKKRIKLLEEKINRLDAMSSRETNSSTVQKKKINKKKTRKKKTTRRKTDPQPGNVKK
jgi:class III poly(R)-hydroxyalkanoic acid synthase PhaE subunit